MKKTSADFIEDMLESIRKGIFFISGMTFSDFINDDKTQYALIRAIEVIGEASAKISDDIKSHYPEIPWKEMSGMRNKLVHDYFGVNSEVVWKTAVEDLPKLERQVEQIILDLK
ncbi:MAG TPA: DUF86 domain-containing protein [Ignavibacteriales bacterium]|nr:DUF86 domain-containing protein [Ignavibacteriales bacterium]